MKLIIRGILKRLLKRWMLQQIDEKLSVEEAGDEMAVLIEELLIEIQEEKL
jgi:hypothetical protein